MHRQNVVCIQNEASSASGRLPSEGYWRRRFVVCFPCNIKSHNSFSEVARLRSASSFADVPLNKKRDVWRASCDVRTGHLYANDAKTGAHAKPCFVARNQMDERQRMMRINATRNEREKRPVTVPQTSLPVRPTMLHMTVAPVLRLGLLSQRQVHV